MELRDGQAVWYRRQDSEADAGVFWHAGSVLALPESGMPSQYSRLLGARGVRRRADRADRLARAPAGRRRRAGAVRGRRRRRTEDGGGRPKDGDGIFLRIGEWDAAGALRTAQAVELERATWQHDIGVTAEHVVFIESPTDARLAAGPGARRAPCPSAGCPGPKAGSAWCPRGDGTVRWFGSMRWIRLDPCLVTHVLGAYDDDDGATAAHRPLRLPLRRARGGQPVDLVASVVGAGRASGSRRIGGTGRPGALADRGRREVERVQVDERHVEYPRMDAACEGGAVPLRLLRRDRLGAASGEPAASSPDREVDPVGLLKFDLARDEVAAWSPGPGRTPSEPLFVRAVDGHGDDEGWLLTVVDDANRAASDLYVLDASSFGRRRPEAVIHLPGDCPSAATASGSPPTATADTAPRDRAVRRLDVVPRPFMPAWHPPS